jgi:hypothetical protein
MTVTIKEFAKMENVTVKKDILVNNANLKYVKMIVVEMEFAIKEIVIAI